MSKIEVDPKKAREAIGRGTFCGFVPHRLAIAERPELHHYPFNVLFMSHTIKDGQQVSGTALYEPEFHTYKKEGTLSFMKYRNVYGSDCHLLIVYDEKNKLYHGEKFVNGELVSSADGGNNWNQFFVQLTMAGLVAGEKCMFRLVDESSKRELINNL